MSTEDARTSPLYTFLIVAAALATNVGLSLVNTALNLPFFLDAIGTAVAAATIGIVPALVVAVGTNALFEAAYGFTFTHLPFAICGVATVLIIRGFVRSGRFGSVSHALFASLAVAMANATLGAMIATLLFGGITGVGIDFLVTGLVASGRSLLSASFWARVPANIIDKTIAVFVAYVAYAPLRRIARRSLSGRRSTRN
jgi:energy-coupling factor transport system substrate-specific component